MSGNTRPELPIHTAITLPKSALSGDQIDASYHVLQSHVPRILDSLKDLKYHPVHRDTSN